MARGNCRIPTRVDDYKLEFANIIGLNSVLTWQNKARYPTLFVGVSLRLGCAGITACFYKKTPLARFTRLGEAIKIVRLNWYRHIYIRPAGRNHL